MRQQNVSGGVLVGIEDGLLYRTSQTSRETLNDGLLTALEAEFRTRPRELVFFTTQPFKRNTLPDLLRQLAPRSEVLAKMIVESPSDHKGRKFDLALCAEEPRIALNQLGIRSARFYPTFSEPGREIINDVGYYQSVIARTLRPQAHLKAGGV